MTSLLGISPSTPLGYDYAAWRDFIGRLEDACGKGEVQTVLRLLDSGNPPYDQTLYDFLLSATCDSSIRAAYGRYGFEGYAQTATLLMDRGADPNARTQGERTHFFSPLILAVANSHVELSRLLLARGASVNAYGPSSSLYHQPALVVACGDHVYNHDSAVDLALLLLDQGADIHLPDSFNGRTPLHEACRVSIQEKRQVYVVRKIRIARLLLEQGAASDIYRKDKKGGTPLDVPYEPVATHRRYLVQHPRMKAFLRKHFAITVRKYVIGPPAEHPSRRIEHQAPLIASFLI